MKTYTDKEIERLSEIALEHEEGGNLALWPVKDNVEECAYWKEVWILGFRACIKIAEENPPCPEPKF